LDAELEHLKPLVDSGEAIQSGTIPAQKRTNFLPSKYLKLEDKPEFDTSEGARLHVALVRTAYAHNLRDYLIRKSRDAANQARAAKGVDLLKAPLP
jgi:hypothetical protein